MTTQPDSDTDTQLLALVRAVDPVRKPRMQTSAGPDTESALRLLAPKLDRAPTSPHRRSRRRSALHVALLAATVAAVVFGAANVVSTGNSAGVSQAQAQTILRHIRDALTWPPRAIYEEEDKTTVTARDGATFTSESHEWLGTSQPHDGRLIQIANGKVQWEQAFVNRRLDIYAPTTNTVYLAPQVERFEVTDAPQWNSALSEVQYLLQQSATKINTHVMLDGKPAIELTFDRGRFSYWISPRSYQPLQSVDRADRLPDGQSGVGVTRYPIARVLTGSAAAHNLLSLKAAHPSATVDHSPANYAKTLSRLHHVGIGVL